jgi:hypothetical protein
MQLKSLCRAAMALSGALLFASASWAKPLPPGPPATRQITQTIDNTQRMTLSGNTSSFVTSGVDQGALSSDTQIESMWLLLKRSPAREQALEGAIKELHDPNSQYFHQWLTAQQLGDAYGPDPADIATVQSWLQSNGFNVGNVTESGLIIEFSGSAAQIGDAFGTSMHSYDVDGQTYFSNATDPSIPLALSPVVVGVVSLNNHFPHSMMTKHQPKPSSLQPQPPRAEGSLAKGFPWQPAFTFTDTNGSEFAIAPADFNTIYNVGPVWTNGYRGAGQTIVVVEDTTIKNVGDVQTFRTAFGLNTFAGTFSQASPTGSLACTAPGVNGDESEAALDAEWAGATAPDAAVLLAACKDVGANFGGLTAAMNLLNSANPPSIISVSYGECEAGGGAALNAMFNTGWQQAAAEGASVFVSSGDESATSCDANRAEATHGIGVSGWASTPYNVAVGGTDFRDLYDEIGPVPPTGVATGVPQSAFWNASNDATGGSAKSYIAEIPWNDSCASFFLFNLEGFPDGVSFCNASGVTSANFISTGSGSGGPSGCATGSASTSGVVSGTCAGYAKPYWQANVVGIVNDGVRDLPDVSLFASNGFWSHFYWYCLTDAAEGGGTCDYFNDPDDAENFNAAGGTSFSAPALAGIQALINQASGQKWGNMNTRYYALGAAQYGSDASPNATNLTNCNSNNGASVGSTCIFRDVTSGDFDVPCRKGSPNCFVTAASTGAGCGGSGATKGCGIVSTSTTVSQPAYQSTPGWDFTTGLGTLNVANLVTAMGVAAPATQLVFTGEPNTTYASGATISVQVTVADGAGNKVPGNTSPVTLALSGGTAGATLGGTTTVNAVNGIASFAVTVDFAGTGYQLVATSSGLTSATSTAFAITKANQTITFTSTAPANAVVGGTYTPTATSSSGLPVTITVDASSSAVCSISGGVVTFNAAGTCTIDANQAGNGAFNAATQVQQMVVVATPVLVFTTQPADVAQGAALGTIAVTEEDGSGNVIADNTTVVDFTVAACGGTVDLGTATMVNGVATLDVATIFYTPASNLQIQASAGALGVSSGTFNVTADADIIFADGFEGCRL